MNNDRFLTPQKFTYHVYINKSPREGECVDNCGDEIRELLVGDKEETFFGGGADRSRHYDQSRKW